MDDGDPHRPPGESEPERWEALRRKAMALDPRERLQLLAELEEMLGHVDAPPAVE